MIRALVFDFDGLILDTEEPWFQLWQETFAEHGAVLEFETYAQIIGTSLAAFDPYQHLEERSGRAIDRETLRTSHDARYQQLIHARPVLPGVEAYLSEARQLGLRLGLASSSSRAWVVGHLDRLGLTQHFDAIRCAEDVPRVKPDPALYLAALDALGVSGREAIAIEDSPNGIRAARAAGMFCVAVPNPLTSRLPIEDVDLRLTSLADMPLPDLLRLAAERAGSA